VLVIGGRSPEGKKESLLLLEGRGGGTRRRRLILVATVLVATDLLLEPVQRARERATLRLRRFPSTSALLPSSPLPSLIATPPTSTDSQHSRSRSLPRRFHSSSRNFLLPVPTPTSSRTESQQQHLSQSCEWYSQRRYVPCHYYRLLPPRREVSVERAKEGASTGLMSQRWPCRASEGGGEWRRALATFIQSPLLTLSS
jgi:hypothetical protein